MKLTNILALFALVSASAAQAQLPAEPARTSPIMPPPWAGKLAIFSNNCAGHSFSLDQAEKRLLIGQIGGSSIDAPYTQTHLGLGQDEIFVTNGRVSYFLQLDLYGAVPGQTTTVALQLGSVWVACQAQVSAPSVTPVTPSPSPRPMPIPMLAPAVRPAS